MSADRVLGLIRRVLRMRIDTSTPGVQADIESLAGETHRDVEVAESYGETACPPDDVLEGPGLFVGGESDHGMVLAWLDRVHRPTGLEPGETVRYSMFGQRIKFDKLGQVLITDGSGSTVQMLANGDIVCTPSSGLMVVDGELEVTQNMNIAGELHVIGNIKTDSNVQADLDVTAGAISLQNHLTTNVVPGGGLSGVPT